MYNARETKSMISAFLIAGAGEDFVLYPTGFGLKGRVAAPWKHETFWQLLSLARGRFSVVSCFTRLWSLNWIEHLRESWATGLARWLVHCGQLWRVYPECKVFSKIIRQAMNFAFERGGPLNVCWSRVKIQIQKLVSSSIESFGKDVVMNVVAHRMTEAVPPRVD